MLPDSVAAARRLVNRRAVLRVVSGPEAGVLPDDPDALVAPRTKPVPRLFVGIVLAGLSAGLIWLVAGTASDGEGFLLRSWNVLGAILPWILLGPLWIGYLLSWRRNEVNEITENYDRFKAAATRFEGRVKEIRVAVNTDARARRILAQVAYGPDGDWAGAIVVARLAPGPKPLQSVLPRPGDPAYVWIQRVEGAEFAVVQTSRSLAPPGKESAGTLSAELARLAELHDSGHLSAEEFAAAKRRILEG